MIKKVGLLLIGIAVLIITYFLFFTVVAVDPECGGCEMGKWMRPYEAILKGKKIIGPYFNYKPITLVEPVATVNPVFHPNPTSKTFQPFTAQFTIITHGTKRIFTDPKYHNQSTDVYLTANDPSVIHVEKEGLTWADFFATLPFSVTKECLTTGTKQTFCQSETQTLSFSINGKLNPQALDSVIQPNDQFLLSVDGQ
jgi:hypothetical protein